MPSLEFSGVMFLGGLTAPLTVIQTVNLNSKFCSFLVWIFVQKDNTIKFLKSNFIQRNMWKFVKELVIRFHRISAAPWGHVVSTIK